MSTDRIEALRDEAVFLAELGGRLRAVRRMRRMSRHDLAYSSRVSERYIAMIEGGKGNVSVLLLRRLALALCTVPLENERMDPPPNLLRDKVETLGV